MKRVKTRLLKQMTPVSLMISLIMMPLPSLKKKPSSITVTLCTANALEEDLNIQEHQVKAMTSSLKLVKWSSFNDQL